MKNGQKEKHTIVYFLDYGKGLGGAGHTLLRQAALMKQAGNRTVLFFSDYEGKGLSEEYAEICDEMGIVCEWATYQITNQPEDIDLICLDRGYEALRDKILMYQPDILHSVQLNPCVELISRELKIPHIMNIYPLLPEFFSITYMNIFPHYHLCDSRYYADKWQYFLHTDSRCIRNAADRKGHKEKFGKKEINFICVGAVYQEKNQLTVIRAFHEALIQGIRGKLTVCGYMGGGYGQACVQYVESHHLQEHILLKGFCPDLDREYEESDVLICGSMRESYPNVISEAMANGLVVVSTPVGGVPEVIIDGKNGYLTKGYTQEALLEKIKQVQRDIENGQIKEIAANTEKTFLAYHSPEAVTGQLKQYYAHVLEDYQEKAKEKNSEKGGVTVDRVRNAFRPFFRRLADNREKITDMQIVSRKLWYVFHIRDRIKQLFEEGREVYIWGTGKYGVAAKEIADIFLEDIRLAGFLDSRKRGTFLGYPIFLPDEMIKKDDGVILVAAINGQSEMLEKMKEYKKVFHRDYFILAERIW